MRVLTLFVPVLLALAAACEEKPAPAAPAAAPLDAKTLSGLAASDKADGKEDKVVHKCPSCMLKMEGAKEHQVHVGDYEVHACSAECKEIIGKDPGSVFGKLAE